MADDNPLAAGIDFFTFVLSLGSSAFVHLGDAPNPESGTLQVNLVLAKQTIDIIGMLQAKTKGNLTAEEGKLLDDLLLDLRLRYVQKTTGKGEPEGR